MANQLWEKTKAAATPLVKAAWSDSALRIVLINAIIVAVLSIFHGCSTAKEVVAYQQQLKEWKEKATVVMAANDRTNHLVDSLQKANVVLLTQAKAKTSEIATIQTSQTKMRQKNDSILAVLNSTLPVVCDPAITLAANYRKEADTLTVALTIAAQRDSLRLVTISNLTTEKDSLKVSNDSLVKALKTVPEYHPPKILGVLPYPTRTQAFGVGTVLGILGTVAAVVVLHK